MGQQARVFSSTFPYSVGDLVLYDGYLYRFTSAHSIGAWNPSDVEAVDEVTEQDLTRVLAAYGDAMKATAYADTVVFEPVQIENTRYKYVLTNAQDPRI